MHLHVHVYAQEHAWRGQGEGDISRAPSPLLLALRVVLWASPLVVLPVGVIARRSKGLVGLPPGDIVARYERLSPRPVRLLVDHVVCVPRAFECR